MICPITRTIAVQQAINFGFPKRQCIAFLDPEYQQKPNQIDAVKKITPIVSEGGLVLIRGGVGTGKTALACSYGYGWYRRGYSSRYGKARYWRQTGLLNEQKSSFSNRQTSDPFSLAQDCGLLVIDELLATHESAFDQNALRDILDVRYAGLKPTILITNLGDDGLRSALDSPTLDRIRDQGVLVEVTGRSIR